jgi:alkylated DNA nucleotide flippase Atl1
MATINLVNNGKLNSSVTFQDALVSAYTDLTYAQRLNQTLNALRDFDRNATSDFRSGGYLNSYVNGSVTTVLLDNYQVEMTGSLGANSSSLSQYRITHLVTGDSVTYSGNLSYNSFPMYSGTYLIPGSVISAVAWSSSGSVSWIEGTAVLQNDLLTLAGTLRKATGATLTSGGAGAGEFYGQITDLNVSSSYNLSTGNASFSGSVTRQSVGVANTSLAQLRSSGTFNVTDYITIDGISADVNSRSIVDFYAGSDLVSLSGSVGTTFYSGSGNDTITGSEVSDSIAGEIGNDSLDGRGGNDTAIYTGNYNQYSFSKNGSAYVVTDSVSNRDGVDSLSNIEFVKFSDKTVSVSDLISQTSTGEVSVSGTATNSAGKNESVVGSSQIDKFVYTTSASSYQVINSSGRVTVKNISSGEEDSLTNIERIKFTDKSMAFDTAGNAGKAYRVYKAAFARDPQSGDMSGLGFWISRIDNGMDMVEVAARFIDSNEFRSLYGQNPTNSEFLTKVYTNVLGRTPDQGGYNWWLNELNTNPSKTKSKVLADFAESSENQTGVASLIGNGIQYMEIV